MKDQSIGLVDEFEVWCHTLVERLLGYGIEIKPFASFMGKYALQKRRTQRGRRQFAVSVTDESIVSISKSDIKGKWMLR